jgi:hypothetical protein
MEVQIYWFSVDDAKEPQNGLLNAKRSEFGKSDDFGRFPGTWVWNNGPVILTAGGGGAIEWLWST